MNHKPHRAMIQIFEITVKFDLDVLVTRWEAVGSCTYLQLSRVINYLLELTK